MKAISRGCQAAGVGRYPFHRLLLLPPVSFSRRPCMASRFSKDNKMIEEPRLVPADDAASMISSSCNSSAECQQVLLKQLLQLQSISSMDDDTAGDASAPIQGLGQHHLPAPSTSRTTSSPSNLYEDDSAVDHDPLLLDMLGFTCVSQYLQHRLDLAVKQAKVACIAAAIWGGLSLALVIPLGGPTAYYAVLRQLGSSHQDVLSLVWLHLLGYFTAKGAVMSLATGWREWHLRAAEPERLAVIEQLQSRHQRRAFWELQEKLVRAENRANRCYTEFALASLLLGLLLSTTGGPDHLGLELETLDQQAMSSLLIMLMLFWESYFTGVGACVQLVQLGAAFINKVSHQAKWGRTGGRNKQT